MTILLFPLIGGGKGGPAFGDLWITYNSGGDSITGFYDYPDRLFQQDTLTICDSPVSRIVKLSRDDCNILASDIPAIEGSKNYSIGTVSGDSVVVTFSPTNLSDSSGALLLITSSKGKTDTIRLVGKIATSGNNLNCNTQDQTTDTIGGTVRVPLSIQTFTGPKDMEIVLHYDASSDLIYQGSVSPNGVRLDIPGEQWPGRSKLKLSAAMSNEKLAEAIFSVFADSSRRPKVWFDSLNIPSSTVPCEFSTPPIAVSTIIPPHGCGTSILSKFMQGETPIIIIRPNPAANTITITSTLNFTNCHIIFFDQLGKEYLEVTRNLSKTDPKSIDVSLLPNGVYTVRIEADRFISTQSLVIVK